MSGNVVMKYLLSLWKLESQSSIGNVRFGLTIIMFFVLVNFDTGSGRVAFACGSEANDELNRRCFSNYSADMSSFFFANTFVWMTAGALIVLWVLIAVYSSKHLQKIRGNTNDTELRKQLCRELWEKSLLHVCSELVLVIPSLIFFCCTQKISLPETYNCTVWNASKKIVLTCEDMHHWNKSRLNWAYVFMMAGLVLLCIVTIIDAMHNKEHFIKDLLKLKYTKEKEADPPLIYKRQNMDAATVLNLICLDLAKVMNSDWQMLGGQLLISSYDIDKIDTDNKGIQEKTIEMFKTWRHRFGEGATIQVLRKALQEIERTDLLQRVEGYTDSSRQFPNLTEATQTQIPPPTESSLMSNIIRHR